MSIIGPRPVAQDQFDMFRCGKWNDAAKVPVGLSGPAALYDYIYGDQITDEKEYM
jgi:lipopolysaccharide/colanic/teichoic acid biosynthesis glycosyltransferase